MSNLESALECVAKHVLSIDEFNFEVRNLKVIISPKLKNERTEEDLVYFLQDAIYRKANEINNQYKGEGCRSLQLDFNGKDAIYVNFNSVPKIKKQTDVDFNEMYKKALEGLDLKVIYDFNMETVEKYINAMSKNHKTHNDNLFDQFQNKVQVGTINGQKVTNMLWDNAMESLKGDK